MITYNKEHKQIKLTFVKQSNYLKVNTHHPSTRAHGEPQLICDESVPPNKIN